MGRFIKNILSNSRLAGAGIVAVSVMALASAFTAQYVFGLDPCPLCIYQRWPYALTTVLGIVTLALALRGKEKPAALCVFLAGLSFLTGGVIASYHVGVEHHWWASFLEGCSADFSAMTPEELLKHLSGKPAVRCDAVAWQMFGISMAGYNAMMSLGLAAGSVLSAIFIARKANGMLD